MTQQIYTLTPTQYAQIVEALENQQRGLEWYRDMCPQDVNGSDDEADAQTNAALTLLRSLEPVEPVAYRHLHEDGWEYYDAPTGSDCDGCVSLYAAKENK